MFFRKHGKHMVLGLPKNMAKTWLRDFQKTWQKHGYWGFQQTSQKHGKNMAPGLPKTWLPTCYWGFPKTWQQERHRGFHRPCLRAARSDGVFHFSSIPGLQHDAKNPKKLWRVALFQHSRPPTWGQDRKKVMESCTFPAFQASNLRPKRKKLVYIYIYIYIQYVYMSTCEHMYTYTYIYIKKITAWHGKKQTQIGTYTYTYTYTRWDEEKTRVKHG